MVKMERKKDFYQNTLKIKTLDSFSLSEDCLVDLNEGHLKSSSSHNLGFSSHGDFAQSLRDCIQTPTPYIDLYANCDIEISPNERALIPTGISLELPSGYGGFILIDSFFCKERAVMLCNPPGLIDSGYRGEIKVSICSFAKEKLLIKRGKRIAQLISIYSPQHNIENKDLKMNNNVKSSTLDDHTIRFSILCDVVDIPTYSHESDNGIDLSASCDFSLKPFEILEVGLGVGLELPQNKIGLILPRSGLSFKDGLTLANSPQIVIAPDISREITATFINLDPNKTIEIAAGSRVAQLVILDMPNIQTEVVSELSKSSRGSDGFGSSGV